MHFYLFKFVSAVINVSEKKRILLNEGKIPFIFYLSLFFFFFPTVKNCQKCLWTTNCKPTSKNVLSIEWITISKRFVPELSIIFIRFYMQASIFNYLIATQSIFFMHKPIPQNYLIHFKKVQRRKGSLFIALSNLITFFNLILILFSFFSVITFFYFSLFSYFFFLE